MGEVFWTWLVFRGLLLNVGCTLGALVLVGVAPEGATGLLWLAAGLHLAAIPYNVACLLGVWRSAARGGAEPSADRYRAVALLVVAAYVVL